MSNLVDIATAVAEDTKNKVYGVFTDAYTMAEGVYNGKYTLAEGLKLLDSSSEKAWKKYFEDVTVHTINKWNSVALRYDAFLKTREALGLPLFDDDSTMVQEYDVSKPGWTKADDEYLRSVHNIVIKIAKYLQDVDNGVRSLVWDSVNQDAAILGVEGEPTITTGKELNAPVGYNPKNGDLLLGNFVEGQKHVLPADFISGAVGVGSVEVVGGLIVGGLLIVCLTVGTVLVVNKICDALNDHLARAEAADIRRQQDKVIKDCSAMCPPNDMTCYDNCLNKAQNLTKVTSEAVKTNEKARAEANAQSDTKKLYETITKVSFVALGIAAIGGVSYAIYRFAGPRSKQITEGRYPRLERGSPMLDAEVVSSRTLREPEWEPATLNGDPRLTGEVSNRYEAMQLDAKGDFYVDWDDESYSYCVFGTESGFCYASSADKKEAEQYAKRMRRNREFAAESEKYMEPGSEYGVKKASNGIGWEVIEKKTKKPVNWFRYKYDAVGAAKEYNKHGYKAGYKIKKSKWAEPAPRVKIKKGDRVLISNKDAKLYAEQGKVTKVVRIEGERYLEVTVDVGKKKGQTIVLTEDDLRKLNKRKLSMTGTYQEPAPRSGKYTFKKAESGYGWEVIERESNKPVHWCRYKRDAKDFATAANEWRKVYIMRKGKWMRADI